MEPVDLLNNIFGKKQIKISGIIFMGLILDMILFFLFGGIESPIVFAYSIIVVLSLLVNGSVIIYKLICFQRRQKKKRCMQ